MGRKAIQTLQHSTWAQGLQWTQTFIEVNTTFLSMASGKETTQGSEISCVGSGRVRGPGRTLGNSCGHAGGHCTGKLSWFHGSTKHKTEAKNRAPPPFVSWPPIRGNHHCGNPSANTNANVNSHWLLGAALPEYRSTLPRGEAGRFQLYKEEPKQRTLHLGCKIRTGVEWESMRRPGLWGHAV